MRNQLTIYAILTIINLQAQTKVFSNNNKPRIDANGRIVDAHDGRVIQFGKKFFWYGTQYGNTNGFTGANEFVCYSSVDLNTWKYEGVLLKQKPAGVFYRPHVVYNAKTKKYVLWYNWYPQLWSGQFGVATSDAPTGPFIIVNSNVSVKQNALGVGDLGVYVDDDGKAYLSYNTIQNHKVSVELLDESYTASTMEGSDFIAQHCEAGSMFKRNGIYYLLTDYTCCFCTQGSGAQVFTASSPLGPYSFRQNINRYPGVSAPLLKDGEKTINQFETLASKENHAIEIWLKKNVVVSSLSIHQFTGNRSGQCGEVDNPAVHQPILEYSFQLQYFYNGEWKTMQAVKPLIRKNNMMQVYNISFKAVTAERFRIIPLYSDSASPLHLTEIEIAGTTIDYVFKTAKQDGKPIIPAQQAYVMELQTPSGKQYSWMGDLWGSSSGNKKGEDYQFWSAPLQFYPNGLMKPLKWVDQWSLIIK